MDPHLINEVESAFGGENIATTLVVTGKGFGLYTWFVQAHSPSDWAQYEIWDRGITFGAERAWRAALEAERSYIESVRRQESWLRDVVDEDDPREWL